jgi:hypothetical protein
MNDGNSEGHSNGSNGNGGNHTGGRRGNLGCNGNGNSNDDPAVILLQEEVAALRIAVAKEADWIVCKKT